MRTVKELIEELNKFDGDLECYAYEGEFQGIVICNGKHGREHNEGRIHCGEGDGKEKESKLI